MLIQEMKEILRDLNDKFLNKFFESFWKHQPKVMCYFEDTIMIFTEISKSLKTLFACT